MPARLPTATDLGCPEAQADYVSDAFGSGDPFLVVLVEEIGMVRHVPLVLDENPKLIEVLRAMSALQLELRAIPCGPGVPFER